MDGHINLFRLAMTGSGQRRSHHAVFSLVIMLGLAALAVVVGPVLLTP